MSAYNESSIFIYIFSCFSSGLIGYSLYYSYFYHYYDAFYFELKLNCERKSRKFCSFYLYNSLSITLSSVNLAISEFFYSIIL